MKNRPIIITGCQRSGTTLLHLILNSHPEINGIDETEFRLDTLADYVVQPDYHPNVCFKLPIYSHFFPLISELEGPGLLWCVRDPRDVVASMVRLELSLDGTVSVPWASHPFGSHQEILNCYPVLDNKVKRKLQRYIRRYEQICTIHPAERSREHAVFSGALCWRIKNELLAVYKRKKIAFKIVRFEKLISQPEQEIIRILNHLNVNWDDNVLDHHRLHAGFAVGGTNKSRPIDSNNTGKWIKTLRSEDVSIIKDLCSGLAGKLGYRLL